MTEPETSAAAPAPSPAAPQEAAAPASAGSNANMPEVLEQLRTLGELRDAGYVTDEEFEAIKRRILDSTR